MLFLPLLTVPRSPCHSYSVVSAPCLLLPASPSVAKFRQASIAAQAAPLLPSLSSCRRAFTLPSPPRHSSPASPRQPYPGQTDRYAAPFAFFFNLTNAESTMSTSALSSNISDTSRARLIHPSALSISAINAASARSLSVRISDAREYPCSLWFVRSSGKNSRCPLPVK